MSARTRLLLALGVVASLLAGFALFQLRGSDDGRTDLAALWFTQTAEAVQVQAQDGAPDPVRTRTWALAWWAADRAVAQVAKVNGNQAATEAAIGAAVHDVLVALVPERRDALDDALEEATGSLEGDLATGRSAGRAEATAVLEERQGDGLTTAEINRPYATPVALAPGEYRPTPPDLAPGQQSGEGDARPFFLTSTDQFDPGPPPPLDSPTYAKDLAEVRAIGEDTSQSRTAEQTEVARFWGPSLVALFTRVLDRQTAGMPLTETAGLLSDFWRISLDAQLAVYDSKYVHLLWRPVTALQTGPAPGWLPLLNTPPQPEYPSAHTAIAAAAAAVLDERLGATAPFELESPGAPGVTRRYSSWEQLVQENIDGRVWAGVHYRHSDDVGADLGRRVAAYGLTQLDR